MLKYLCLVPFGLLSACATIVAGTSQTVTVSTTPPGASCTLDRIGERVGAISPTPGSVRVDKSKNDLSVTCSKEGFQTATVGHSSNFNGATFGNILVGGVIGVVVDAASGANFNYPPDVRMELAATQVPSVPPVAGPYVPGGPIRLFSEPSQADTPVALYQPVAATGAVLTRARR